MTGDEEATQSCAHLLGSPMEFLPRTGALVKAAIIQFTVIRMVYFLHSSGAKQIVHNSPAVLMTCPSATDLCSGHICHYSVYRDKQGVCLALFQS